VAAAAAAVAAAAVVVVAVVAVVAVAAAATEKGGLEMPFELMPPSVASVVQSHLVEGLPMERPET